MRRTGRVSTPLEDMEKGESIRQVARRMNICRMTLKQYSEKRRTGLANQVFDEHRRKNWQNI